MKKPAPRSTAIEYCDVQFNEKFKDSGQGSRDVQGEDYKLIIDMSSDIEKLKMNNQTVKFRTSH